MLLLDEPRKTEEAKALDAKVDATKRLLDRLFAEHAATALAYSGGAPSVTAS